MFRISILAICLSWWLSYGDVVVSAFGVESVVPILHSFKTDLSLIQQAAFTTIPTYGSHYHHHTIALKDLSHLIPSIHSVNNLPTYSNLNLDTNNLLSTTSDVASSILKDYKAALDAHPLKTKVTTGCLLAVVGDAIAQSCQPENYSQKRAAAFVVFDAVWRTVQQVTYGPIIQNCNGDFSSSLLKGILPLVNNPQFVNQDDNKIVLGAIEQTLVSQLILIPLLYYPIFYFVTGKVQNLTIQETVTRAQETFVPLMKRNLLFWIPVQFCAFYFVEENLQIPVLTACGLVWTVILSLSAGKVNSTPSKEKDDTINTFSVEEKMIADARKGKGTTDALSKSLFNLQTDELAKYYGETTNGNIRDSSTLLQVKIPPKRHEEF